MATEQGHKSIEQSGTNSKKNLGVRVSGKIWKEQKKPLRTRAIGVKGNSWQIKEQQRLHEKGIKERFQDLKQEKQDRHDTAIERLKQRRKDKEEKERYALLEEKMHKKRVERLKRKEKRNKLLKER